MEASRHTGGRSAGGGEVLQGSQRFEALRESDNSQGMASSVIDNAAVAGRCVLLPHPMTEE